MGEGRNWRRMKRNFYIALVAVVSCLFFLAALGATANWTTFPLRFCPGIDIDDKGVNYIVSLKS